MKRITAIVLALGAITLFSGLRQFDRQPGAAQPELPVLLWRRGPVHPERLQHSGLQPRGNCVCRRPTTELEQSRGGVPVRRSLLSGSLALERQRGRAEPPPTPRLSIPSLTKQVKVMHLVSG